MCVCVHSFLGDPLADMIKPDVKPGLFTVLTDEFNKNPKDPNWEPKRTWRNAPATGAKTAAGGAAKGGAGAGAYAHHELRALPLPCRCLLHAVSHGYTELCKSSASL